MPIPIGFPRALVLLTLSASVLVPASPAQNPEPQLAQDTTAAASIEQPIHTAPMDLDYGKPYIQVMVNGKGPFRFVVDTGTGGDALVSPALATQLHLPVVGQANLSDPSGQGSQLAPIVLIDSLEFAGINFTGVRAVDHGFFAEAGQCDGVLGFTLFRSFLLTLDFPNRQILLEQGSLRPDGGKSVLPFRMPHGVPIATLRLDGLQPVEAQLDSGGGGLVIPSHIASQLKYDIAPVVFARGRSVSTRFELKAAKLASDVRIGRYTFTHPVVEIHPAFPLVNFGSPPMQIFAITFDQRNLLVRFAANQKRFSLAAPPSPMRLTHAPDDAPPPPALVPVG
ncbi:MAG TPA: aspartyl protease family protein [Terracidiphilus sp.]|nr:aspartyl protease family protein [Terracidiphilus sp.]